LAIRPILKWGEAVLHSPSSPVAQIDGTTASLVADMVDTMYAAPGIGLAAPQIGVSQRVIVVDVAREGEKRQPVRIANPEIIWRSPETTVANEGCLSVPEHYADVSRAAAIKMRYLDHENEIREIEAEGLLATCLQHEIDHLDGVLFVDHISALKRGMILRKLTKAKRSRALAPA